MRGAGRPDGYIAFARAGAMRVALVYHSVTNVCRECRAGRAGERAC
jgi:hypothetical protein